jgi:hypothetical protein
MTNIWDKSFFEVLLFLWKAKNIYIRLYVISQFHVHLQKIKLLVIERYKLVLIT